VANIADRAAGYSIPGAIADGQDVVAVFDAVSEAVSRARAGMGPGLVETKTYRYFGHSGGPDPDAEYRTQAEVEEWRARDPIVLFRERLLADGVLTETAVKEVEEEERQGIAAAWKFGLESPFPEPDAAFDHLFTNPVPAR
jgi:pyruvate dehydrogenase E1 component alpha subunit